MLGSFILLAFSFVKLYTTATMTDPEQHGVGTQEFPANLQELLQHLSNRGIRDLEIAASTLSQFSVTANRPDLMVQVHALRILTAFAHHALAAAGYDQAKINKVPVSEVPATPHDPRKPRTN